MSNFKMKRHNETLFQNHIINMIAKGFCNVEHE